MLKSSVTRRCAAVVGAVAVLAAGLLTAAPAGANPGYADPGWGEPGRPGISAVPTAANEQTVSRAVAVTPSGATWQSVEVTTAGVAGTTGRLIRRDPVGNVVGSIALSSAPVPTARLVADGEAVYVMLAPLLPFPSTPGSVTRVLPDLTVDASFAGDGVLVPSEIRGSSVCLSLCTFSAAYVAVDDAGRLLIGRGDGDLLRLLRSGERDPSFGQNGLARVLFSIGGRLSFDAERRILLTTTAGVRRLTPDGLADSTFGPNGNGYVPFSTFGTGLTCSVLACEAVPSPDGSILLTNVSGTSIDVLAADGNSFSSHPAPCEGCSALPIAAFVSGTSPARFHYSTGLSLNSVELPLPDGPVVPTERRLYFGVLTRAVPAPNGESAFLAAQMSTLESTRPTAMLAKVRLDVTPTPVVPTGSVSPPSGSWEYGAYDWGGTEFPISYSCIGGLTCEAYLDGGDMAEPAPEGYLQSPWGRPVANGQVVDLSDSGWDVHTLIVRSFDPELGKYVEVARARYQLVYPAYRSESVPDGGTLSTGSVPSPQDLLTTTVRTPVGGEVTISEYTGGPGAEGFAPFNQNSTVLIPQQDPEAPAEATFQLHSSFTGATPASAITVWRDDQVVPNCRGGSAAVVANPSPCVKQRANLSSGVGARVTVLSADSGRWTFGRLTAVPPEAPTGVSVDVAARTAQVSWDYIADEVNGGAPITTVVVTATPIAVPEGVTASARSITLGRDPLTWQVPNSATITSLVPGVTYEVSARAKNSANPAFGPWSNPVGSLVIGGLPGVPSGVSAVPGVRSAMVSWDAPVSDEPLTKYTVVATATRGDGTTHRVTKSVTDVPLATSATVSALTPGLSYSFTVAASSAVGTSAVSASSAPVVLSALPGVPSGVSAVAGIKSAIVSWDAPSSEEPVDRYTVVATADVGDGSVHRVSRSVTGERVVPTEFAMTGLRPGLSYSFTVAASSAVGTSAASVPSAPVVLSALPGVPSGVTAVGGVKSAVVSWDVPASEEPLTKFTVVGTATRGDGTTHRVSKSVTGDPSASELTVTGLTPGLSYSFTVAASSAVGTSASSAPSALVAVDFGISISDRSTTEGNRGSKNYSFTVTLTDAQPAPVTVQVATTNGTADSSDFTALETTVTFEPGEKSKKVMVQVHGDTTVEADETFFVDLSDASRGTVTKARGVGTIINDD